MKLTAVLTGRITPTLFSERDRKMVRRRTRGVALGADARGSKVIVLIPHPQGLWVIGSLIRFSSASLGQVENLD